MTEPLRTRPRFRRIVRALLIAGAVLALIVAIAFRPVLRALGGASARQPSDLASMSPEAQALVDAALSDLDADRMLDLHVHVPGLGAGGSGCSVNPKMMSWLHPVSRVQFLVYCGAAGISDLEHGDQQYVERLLALARGMPKHGRLGVMAFDARYARDGTRLEERTEMFTPDTWPIRLAQEHPDVFVPIISVHPWRPDALEQLERGARAGAKVVKWLPNSMGIDPADPQCDAYYDRMRSLGLALLTHTGAEYAVHAAEDQELGNPLRLRRALDRGVKVILSHCGSAGSSQDLDDPRQPQVEALDLFLRVMDDPRYVGLAFGEISTLTQTNRCGRPLMVMLERTDLHERLVNGSDYPLPAINVLYSTRKLEGLGYITPAERKALNEVYDVNPLLFDLVLKRCLKHPVKGTRFPASVFQARPELGF